MTLKLMQALMKDTEWGDSIEVERKGKPYMDHYLSDRIAEAKANGKVEAYLECELSVAEIAGKLNISEKEVSEIIKNIETEKLQKKN